MRHPVKRPGIPHLALLLAMIIPAACAERAPATLPRAATVFEGARVIVGDGTVLEDAAFVVEGDRVTEMGERRRVEGPAGATRVDLTGKTVMPAIVNAHMHLAASRDELVDQLEHLAYYGVGTAVSLGQDTSDAVFRVRAEPVTGAARARTAGRGITAPEPGRSEAAYWVTTEAAARAAVREQAERRVDLIKVWVDDRDGLYEKLSPELYGSVIDEAHQHGLDVAAHVFTLADAKGLLRAGVDVFAHGVRDRDVDDELIALVRERPDVVLVPNLPERGVAIDLGWLAGTVPAGRLGDIQAASTDQPDAQRFFAIQARNLERLSEAGMRVAFGTDGSTPWAAHVEMEDMVAAGMTPSEVIVAATRTGAELLGLDDLGTIAAGGTADFIVLDANPLDDITNTRRIASVYLRGAPVDRDAIGARLTASPGP